MNTVFVLSLICVFIILEVILNITLVVVIRNAMKLITKPKIDISAFMEVKDKDFITVYVNDNETNFKYYKKQNIWKII